LKGGFNEAVVGNSGGTDRELKPDPPDDLEARILEALARTQRYGVGCGFWLEPELDLSVDILRQAGLISPIRQRVPSCHEHGCHLLGRCQEEIRFQQGEDLERQGIAGRKFRLTEAGGRLANGDGDLSEAFRAAVADSPLCSAVLLILVQRGSRGLTSLELLGELLRIQEQDLEAHGRVPFQLSRWELGRWLKLMEAVGLVISEGPFRRLMPGPALKTVSMHNPSEEGQAEAP
jgi:hypothetical protein